PAYQRTANQGHRLDHVEVIIARYGELTWRQQPARIEVFRLTGFDIDDIAGMEHDIFRPDRRDLAWSQAEGDSDRLLTARGLLVIWVEGVLGERSQVRPVNFPELRSLLPSISFPGRHGLTEVAVRGEVFQFARTSLACVVVC